jgi:hypothetical protein
LSLKMNGSPLPVAKFNVPASLLYAFLARFEKRIEDEGRAHA